MHGACVIQIGDLINPGKLVHGKCVKHMVASSIQESLCQTLQSTCRKLIWPGLCDWIWSRVTENSDMPWQWWCMSFWARLLSWVVCLWPANQPECLPTEREKPALVSWSWEWLRLGMTICLHVSCLPLNQNDYQDTQPRIQLWWWLKLGMTMCLHVTSKLHLW